MEHDYLAQEARARRTIDRQLVDAGWQVQSYSQANLAAGPGVAVREFVLEKGHGRVDYLLFLNGQPTGVIEAKPEGTTLVEVEHQSGKYVDGLPAWMKPPVYPLPFIYESTSTDCYNPATAISVLITRDKASLDIFWLWDESLVDAESLPWPDFIAAETVAPLAEGCTR